MAVKMQKSDSPFHYLVDDVRQLINTARRSVALTVNTELVILYWKIGNAIRKEVLKESRAEYGKAVIDHLSTQLQDEFGTGYSKANLNHFVRFAEIFPDDKIVYAVSRELSWTNLRTLIYLKNDIQREFYVELCKTERWSSRTLKQKIDSMLFERTAIAKKPDEQIKQDLAQLRDSDVMTPDMVFRDPYILDFLDLKDTYSEKDLESAILKEIERFIIEFGSDFAFLARQKRITVDGEDYYIDLLFYHRRMKRLIVIELKLGKFKAAYKGQMELYLRWLGKYEQRESEFSPIGLILCASKSEEHIELLMLDKSNIKVAEYLTELPPKKLLQEKLHTAIQRVKVRIQQEHQNTKNAD